jgi:hypothetical protein
MSLRPPGKFAASGPPQLSSPAAVETNTQHHNTNTNTVLTIFVGLLGFVVVHKFKMC